MHKARSTGGSCPGELGNRARSHHCRNRHWRGMPTGPETRELFGGARSTRSSSPGSIRPLTKSSASPLGARGHSAAGARRCEQKPAYAEGFWHSLGSSANVGLALSP